VIIHEKICKNNEHILTKCEIGKLIECVADRPQYKMSDVDNLETHFSTT
jgi:hypothetical protein